jgi:hypothetical protein
MRVFSENSKEEHPQIQ